MSFNKKRLYIALYPSGVTSNAERRYHWVFIVGPKAEDERNRKGKQYHVKNPLGQGWIYEEVELNDIRATDMLLVRLLIAKVKSGKRLAKILRAVPVVQDDPNWRCRTWIANALAAIQEDGGVVGTSMLDWPKIEGFGREYVRKKADAGRYMDLAALVGPRPTWDLLQNKETAP